MLIDELMSASNRPGHHLNIVYCLFTCEELVTVPTRALELLFLCAACSAGRLSSGISWTVLTR